MALHLQPGTLLDGRYRIDAVLGQGGFGITYAAENARIGMKVAVKELFWRDHSVRAAEASPEVALADAADGPVFDGQKERFLKEARILKDLNGQPGVVRVLDFFEANGTAYIVMEFVEGGTLGAKAAAGPMPAGEVMRRFLPLVDTLAQIHKMGVIHRDISPENIMVRPDGSLTLIDFGAAREYMDGDGHYTSLSRESYSPNEQYDSNGRQGPWTDVYALCATMYSCVCGAPPQSAVQRMFLDELKAPSALGVEIDPAHEAILMKGLKLWSGDRYQSMEALAADIRAAEPGETVAEGPRNRWILIGLAAGLLCAVLAVALWVGLRSGQDRFKGVTTEKLRVTAPSDLTAADFAAAQTELRARLDSFAGKGNYILQVKGDHMDVELPLDCFGGQEIWKAIGENFAGLANGKPLNWQYQLQGNWEDPARIAKPGRNQVAYSELGGGETLVYLYELKYDILEREREADFQDLKTRLDALDTPYAFGTLYGNDSWPMFRLSPEHFGSIIEDSLVDTLMELGATNYSNISFSNHAAVLSVVEGEDGAYRLRVECEKVNEIEAYTRAMLDIGLDKLYLCDGSQNTLAFATIDSPITDGVVEFTGLCMEGIPVADEAHRWVLDYLVALMNDTRLSGMYGYKGANYLSASGAYDPDDQSRDIDFGVMPTGKMADDETLALMNRIQEETGYTFTNGLFLWLNMKLPMDDNLLTAIEERVPALMDTYDLWHLKCPKGLYIVLVEETGDTMCRLVLHTNYDYTDKKFYNSLTLAGRGTELEPYSEAITTWWKSFGGEKDNYGDLNIPIT